MRRNRSPLWAGLLFISSLAPPFAGASDVADPVAVRSADGRFSVAAENAPLRQVVAALAAQANLRFVEHVQLDRPVNVNIERQALPDVLAELIGADSYLLYEALPADDPDAEAIPGTLWVFSAGTALAPAATIFFEAALYQGTFRERKQAIRELARLGTPTAVESLSLALSDSDARIRDAALLALAEIGSDAALAAIASATMDSDPRVRAEAATALASGDPETSARYLAMALNDPDSRVRVAVIESLGDVPLGAVPSDHAVATLSRALQDNDPRVRLAAVDAMEEIGGSVAYQSLMQARMDRDPEVADVVNELLESLAERE